MSQRGLHGTEFIDGGVRFRVFAPTAQTLHLRWKGQLLPLTRREDGLFERFVESARHGDAYSYVFEDGRVRPDPATRWQQGTVHGESSLFDPGQHSWKDAGWRGHTLAQLVIYELHLGTFTEEGTLDAALARLPDLVELGITCVELLPVQPFPGERNWGYDGVAPFGVQHSYGGPAALQRFVDGAHRLGLSVCLDVVYNHLGPEGNYLRDFGPYFTSRHKTPWGDGLNFDGPDAGPVRALMVEAAVQWVRDFHVDALRLDAVHAIVDDSPTHLVAELTAAVQGEGQRAGREVHLIAESDLNDRKLVEPPPGGWGVSTVWADDLHHAVHALLTGERASFYADYGGPEQVTRALSSGFVLQGEQSIFRKKPHGTPTAGLAPARFTVCAQNHDQVGNRPGGERITQLLPWEALPAVAALTTLGSGLPMLFMGEEYGETQPFLYFTSHGDPELARAVSEGRKAEFIAAGEVPDPQAEETFQASKLTHRRDGRHGALREIYRSLLAIRRKHLPSISAGWPEVKATGRTFRLQRPGLTVTVNLSPEPSGELAAWGTLVEES